MIELTLVIYRKDDSGIIRTGILIFLLSNNVLATSTTQGHTLLYLQLQLLTKYRRKFSKNESPSRCIPLFANNSNIISRCEGNSLTVIHANGKDLRLEIAIKRHKFLNRNFCLNDDSSLAKFSN